jgi:hypothetical protein
MNGMEGGSAAMAAGRRSQVWVWFFIVLAVLTLLWLGGLWWRSEQLRLTPERLVQARALWDQKRPRNYNLTYTKYVGTSGDHPDTIWVQVHNGKADQVTLNGRPITQDDRPLSPSRYGRYDMSGLLDDIAEFLDIDAKQPALRAVTLAQFSADDGHLLLYSRQVPGTADTPSGSIKVSEVKLEVLDKPAGTP